MGIKQTLDVINAMEAAGVVGRYAIAGAVASYYYIEPAVTEDLDILISLDEPQGGSALITLSPILDFLRARGYADFQHEGLMIEGWPVQFLPVADDLDKALAMSDRVEIEVPDGNVSARVLRAEHLVAIAVKVGRAKDYGRISQFLSEGAVGTVPLRDVLRRHRLEPAWLNFCAKSGVEDPLGLRSSP